MHKAIDGYPAAAGLDVPDQLAVPDDDWLPSEPDTSDLADSGITSDLWTTGYGWTCPSSTYPSSMNGLPEAQCWRYLTGRLVRRGTPISDPTFLV